MNEFKTLKEFIWLPFAVALLQSCTSVVDRGSDLIGIGYASDTTAILFYELWETTESFNIPVRSNVTSYYGWELKLVDVRFHNVYWETQIEYERSNSAVLRGKQWNDSTMLIDTDGDGYWLWTVGNKKPQKVNFNWNTEVKGYETGGLLFYNIAGCKLRPWKNGSILSLCSDNMNFIIDSGTMTVNDWFSIGENAWIAACEDFWWGKNGGACLVNKNPDGFALLSEKRDTLGNFTYAPDCVDYYSKGYISNEFRYNFIEVILARCKMNVCDNCPAKKKVCGASYAYIRYDDKWNIDKEPLFWLLWDSDAMIFLDSLENITRYER